MSRAGASWFGRAVVVAVVAVGLAAAGGAWAKSPSSPSGSRSSSAPSSWTSKSSVPQSSGSLWDRSAPPASSGGYAKPSYSAPPSAPAAPANSNVAPAKVAPSSGGYAKPALTGAGVVTGAGVAAGVAAQTPANANKPPDAANSNQPAAGSSGGYTKPGAAAPPAQARSGTPAPPSAPAASSSGGYSKPATGGSPATAGGAGAGGSGPTGGQPPTTGAVRPPASAFDRGAERQLSTQSLSRYKAEQERFTAPAQGTLTGSSDYAKNPLYTANAGHYRTYDQAYAERDAYRYSHPWAPPAYAYRSAPSFGMWDALFWWMVLDKITEPSHAASAYNNMNDPGFQAWRREADRMAQDNAELKAKLNAMDAKLTTMQGQPQKPGTLPEGVPASVALAPAVAVAPQGNATLVMGTGGMSGNYYPFCQGNEAMRGLRGWLNDFVIECKVTNGSADNLDGLAEGKFDAILVQSDVYNQWLVQNPGGHLDALQATVYQEFVQVLANKLAKVERIGDLDPKRHTVYLVGSGAQKTWDSFAALEPHYAAFEAAGRLRRVPNDPQVLDTVAATPDAVMVFVSGLKSPLLRQANDRLGEKLTMVLVDDGKLDDALDRTGHRIYTFAKIPSGIYPNLQKSRWFGLTSAVTSLSVGAVFILSERWVAEHGVSSLSKVEAALWQTIPEIEKKVGVGG